MTLYKNVSPEIPAQPLPVTHRLPSPWLVILMAKVGCIIISSLCYLQILPPETSNPHTMACTVWLSVLHRASRVVIVLMEAVCHWARLCVASGGSCVLTPEKRWEKFFLAKLQLRISVFNVSFLPPNRAQVSV